MPNHFPAIMRVLTAFEIQPAAIRNTVECEGGLSGAKAWKVETDQNSFCLKLMPPDFSVNRLLAIHHAAGERRQKGMSYLAGYLPAASGESYVQLDGGLWELQTWMDGQPPSAPYSTSQKKAMFRAIGEFHALHETPPAETAVSPGIARRIELCEKWRLKYEKHLLPSLHHFGHPQWKSMLEPFLDSFVHYHARLGPLLLSCEHEMYVLDDCIADPRPENFRFFADQLTGLFDLGSMRWDNIALDVSRLASEVSDDGEVDWNFAFQAVNTTRQLTPSEERLAKVFDAANVLLTGLNWVQWLVEEGISFANCDHVSTRLSHLLARLDKIEKHPAWQL